MTLSASAICGELDGHPVLHAVSLGVARGELLGIVGPNGAGKSSLLRILAGLMPITAGAVLLDEAPLSRLAAKARARRIGYLPQHATASPGLRVRELVALGRFPHAPDRQVNARVIAAALARTGLECRADRAMGSLSGGERARAHLARLLAGEHDYLLADEPIAALDPGLQLAFLALFEAVAREGRAVCLVLHDLPLAASYCQRLAVMHEGRIVRDGPASAVLDDACLARVFGVRGVRDPAGRLVALAPTT